jgi:hypothetical protein
VTDTPPDPMTGWDREWSFVRQRAGAPKEPRLGCSTISHERLGFCRACVRTLRDGGPNGSDLEVAGWRLLALATESAPYQTEET